MSLDRRTTNPGRREREAGKRHRRAWVVKNWIWKPAKETADEVKDEWYKAK